MTSGNQTQAYLIWCNNCTYQFYLLHDWHPTNSRCPVCESNNIARQYGLYFSLRQGANLRDDCVYAVPIQEKARPIMSPLIKSCLIFLALFYAIKRLHSSCFEWAY